MVDNSEYSLSKLSILALSSSIVCGIFELLSEAAVAWRKKTVEIIKNVINNIKK